MIPKTIHYIWFGDKKTDIVNICIRNWKDKLPDYDFIEWSENNLPMDELFNSSDFFRICYEKKLWAYVSDYVRFYVLNKYGGIYIDTDITINKSFDDLLYNDFFIGRECPNYIGTAVIGSIRNNFFLKNLIDFYNNDVLSSHLISSPQIVTHLIGENNARIKVYDESYFYPYYMGQDFSESLIKDTTYTIHWWGKSWISNKEMLFLKTKHLNTFDKLWFTPLYYVYIRMISFFPFIRKIKRFITK
ncbi:glycosyltransferase family 32 protein [Photobacterium leiognathi]|uniref:glycosyltransferase family 32 protein n=1 Tax=Photobacterium leiognathi TaxID=553611 RepID=UPI002980F100|nr:glycosyltransferase [Photobacterium leiognathi]